MQTIYIDVYFLINFSLDVISLYFAVMLSRAASSFIRLLLVGGALAGLSVIYLFLPEGFILSALLSVCVGLCVLFLSVKMASIKRRASVLASFVIVEMILGGAVSYFYGTLERLINGYNVGEGDTTNGEILLLALFVILAIGIIRLFVLLFRSRVESSVVKIAIIHKENRILLDALVDSGNLLRDPFDSTAVIMVKERGIFDAYPTLDGKEGVDLIRCAKELGINIHPIPITTAAGTRLVWAFKPEGIEILTDKGRERIALTVALDKEGGDYGGCAALLPSSVIGNAI